METPIGCGRMRPEGLRFALKILIANESQLEGPDYIMLRMSRNDISQNLISLCPIDPYVMKKMNDIRRHFHDQPSPSIRSGARPGFTLIELMVVVVILGVLMAFIIPAAQSLSSSSLITVERNSARDLVASWKRWSLDHDGRLLPGQVELSETLSGNEAPLVWNDTPIPEIARRRWIWRLMPYLDAPAKTLWVNEQQDFWRDAIENASDPSDAVYLITLHPSFGLNTDFLGGRQSGDCDTWLLHEYIQSQDPGAPPLHSDSLSRLRRPADLIAFASSRGPFQDGGADRTVEGFWRLEPPWKPAGDGSAPRWTTNDNGTFAAPSFGTDPQSFGGFLSPRADGRMVVAAPDGHVGLESFEAMGNMRRWSDDATSPHWAPSLP